MVGVPRARCGEARPAVLGLRRCARQGPPNAGLRPDAEPRSAKLVVLRSAKSVVVALWLAVRNLMFEFELQI